MNGHVQIKFYLTNNLGHEIKIGKCKLKLLSQVRCAKPIHCLEVWQKI